MDQLQVHYELFVRTTPGAPWTLEMASENRAQVVETAEDADGREAASPPSGSPRRRSTTTPASSRASSSSPRAQAESSRKRKQVVENREPLCVTPAGPLHRPRPRPDRPAAGRLAGPQPRHAVRAAAPSRPGREARRRRQRAAARRPEDRRARGPGARHLGARADPQLPGPDRARDQPGAGRRPARAASRASPRRPSPPPPSALAGEPERGLPARRRRRRPPGRRRRAGPTRSMRLLDLADAAPAGTAPRRLRLRGAGAAALRDPRVARRPGRAARRPSLDLGGQLAAMTRLAARDAVAALVGHRAGGRQSAAAAARRRRAAGRAGWRSRRSPAPAPRSAGASCAS